MSLVHAVDQDAQFKAIVQREGGREREREMAINRMLTYAVTYAAVCCRTERERERERETQLDEIER